MKKNCLHKNHQYSLKGVTVPELIIVMSIFAALIGIATINLATTKSKSSLNTSVITLISDLKQHQLKSMVGDTEGRGIQGSYGIYFQQNNYTLFHGIYIPGDPSNFTVNLGDNLQIIAPNFSVNFATLSGETATSSVTLQDIPSGSQKIIQLNRFGVVTAVN